MKAAFWAPLVPLDFGGLFGAACSFLVAFWGRHMSHTFNFNKNVAQHLWLKTMGGSIPMSRLVEGGSSPIA